MKVKISAPLYTDIVVDLDTGKVVELRIDPQFGDSYYAEVKDDDNEVVIEGDYCWSTSDGEDGTVTNVEFDKIPQPDGSELWTNRREIKTQSNELKQAQEIVNDTTREAWEALPLRWDR